MAQQIGTFAPPAEAGKEIHEPYVPATTVLPEFTIRALLLGVILSIVLGAANMYVGLKAGLTVAATIPSAVISMSILRFFRRSNVLENTIAMTTGSAGEALGAGLIFTIPALLMLGVWTEIDLLPAIVVGLCGGILGVLFTIPLRRAFVVESRLPYPEGIATAEVLKAGVKDSAQSSPAKEAATSQDARTIVIGMLLGGGYAVALHVLGLWQEVLRAGARLGGAVGYGAFSVAPILLAVGYIVGIGIARLIMLGAGLAFVVLVPGFLLLNGYPTGPDGAPLDPITAALRTWNPNVRLVGIGAIIVGAFYTLARVRTSLVAAAREARESFGKRHVAQAKARTDVDVRLDRVLVGIGLLVIPIFGVFYYFTQNWVQAAVAAAVMAPAAFLFSSVAGYLAGVVGSSNNPISSVTILTILFTSFLLLAMGASAEAGMLAAIGVGAVIACSAAIAGDNLQDLKSGYMLGSTPRYQQLALIVGVVGMALVAPVVLNVIHQTAPGGIGGDQFPAPQGYIMATVTRGVFEGSLPLHLLAVGAVLGLGLVALKLPVLPVAVGIYLPIELSTPIFAGGLLKWGMERYAARRTQAWAPAEKKSLVERIEKRGVLLASGVIAGEALLGITVVFLLFGGQVPGHFAPAIAGILLGGAMYLVASRSTTAVRLGLMAAIMVAGLAATAWLVASGTPYTFEGTQGWPGILIFAYVALLMAYIPLRELFVTARPADGVRP
ncbi:MAG TPA: oligopeptide transporter, OPT family [Candidatus Thermoplasmatota archaeon]|nr:oligopeptide transporter, OPT family [Candidatus Thermoplasmatota archaeon]